MGNRTIGIAAAAATLTLAACGGGSGGPQDEVAELFVDAMADQGIAIDEDCAKDAASELSDEDAQAMVDAGPETGADFSPAATAFAETASSCLDMDALIDQMVSLIGEDLVDGDCLKDAFDGMDPADINSGDFPPEAEACFSDG